MAPSLGPEAESAMDQRPRTGHIMANQPLSGYYLNLDHYKVPLQCAVLENLMPHHTHSDLERYSNGPLQARSNLEDEEAIKARLRQLEVEEAKLRVTSEREYLISVLQQVKKRRPVYELGGPAPFSDHSWAQLAKRYQPDPDSGIAGQWSEQTVQPYPPRFHQPGGPSGYTPHSYHSLFLRAPGGVNPPQPTETGHPTPTFNLHSLPSRLRHGGPMPSGVGASQTALRVPNNHFRHSPTNRPGRTPISAAGYGNSPTTSTKAQSRVTKRKTWTFYRKGGTTQNPTVEKVEMYLRCGRGNTHWPAFKDFRDHVNKDGCSGCPKRVSGLQQALGLYGVPVLEIKDDENRRLG